MLNKSDIGVEERAINEGTRQVRAGIKLSHTLLGEINAPQEELDSIKSRAADEVWNKLYGDILRELRHISVIASLAAPTDSPRGVELANAIGSLMAKVKG